MIATLRMLNGLTPSFMYDLHCVGFIDFYWTIKKIAPNFSISHSFPMGAHFCPQKTIFVFFSTT